MGEKMQEKQGGNSGIVAQFKRFFSGYSVIVITVILFIVAGIFQGQNFLSPQNIINVLRNNAVLGILALGMAFVIIVGEIDLSVGAELVILIIPLNVARGEIIVEVHNVILIGDAGEVDAVGLLLLVILIIRV